MLSYILYNIFLRLYSAFISIASLFNPKAKKWIDGRHNWREKIKADAVKFNRPLWVHAASLGEFEQGRNLIETIKNKYPQQQIVLTFFSPSGYEIRKNYPFADFIYSLPLDYKSNARYFIRLIQPKCAIFIKYDFWYNYFSQLKTNAIPLILVSSVFRKDQIFFKGYAGIFKKILSIPDYYFVQDDISKNLLFKAGILNCEVIPDTRIDRAVSIAEEAKNKSFEVVRKFKNGRFLFLAGSTYQTEENFIFQLAKTYPEIKIIIVPHHVDETNIRRLKEKPDSDAVFWSEIKDSTPIVQKQMLIVDTIGILQYLYQYAEIAMVGGGFNKSIHNILEPATYGIPVLFGPSAYKKFNEAVDLIELKGAFLIRNYEDFRQLFDRIYTDEPFRKQTGNTCKKYISGNSGGTNRVINFLESSLQIF